MNKIKTQIILIFLLINSFNFGFGQEKNNRYERLVYEVYGDLNKDGMSDLVTVREDETDLHHPFLLEIFFQNSAGKYKNVLSSGKAVMERHPYGDMRTELNLENLQIKNGVLIFTNQLIRGNFTHRFRYQNGTFELIGFSSYGLNGGCLEHIDYNLSTGQKIEKQIDSQTDQILKQTKTKVKLSPLPNLKDFAPFDFTY